MVRVFLEVIGHLLRRNAIGLRLAQDVLGEIVLVDTDRALVCDLVQDDLRLESLLAALLQIGPELFLGLIFGDVGEVALERQLRLGPVAR